ncbi:HD-GYP domain-containing protein [Xylophilus sp.]|uniref:HD-GYP domain-containing protein n=1 Tax=Xylophilus sp. TaxID=2653893 RepID=UPI0013BCC68C|nr:phosphohydrolase [Xylophilus sp.]KAF1046854.1 MAG: Cyclic di-GMP phosphodiesterase [Xylophilus sp.]
MSLVTLNFNAIRLGHPLPFPLRGANGMLLAQKGYVIPSREDLDHLIARGMQLCVDTDEVGPDQTVYLSRQRGLRSTPVPEAGGREAGPPDWIELQIRATQLLRAPQVAGFGQRFEHLHDELARHVRRAPDAALLALIYLSADETRMYSATHALLVSAACMLTARDVLRWSDEEVGLVGRAALSMNVGMTALQDTLARQVTPLRSEQVEQIGTHRDRSGELLREAGIDHPVWLEAVQHHHLREPGRLADRTPARRMARLIQRADLFAARIAPRVSRPPMAVTAAMQASYFDEDNRMDEAGAALVKALGIYVPGSFVRLASNEVGIVTRRGASGTTPRVAVLLNRQGLPVAETTQRDTSHVMFKVVGHLTAREAKVQWPLDKVLALA